MTRSEVLSRADSYVNGDREQDYGSPESNFKTIASMWNSYLYGAGLIENKSDEWKGITPHDVAAMLALLKIARIASGHAKADNWVDLAGYAACGGEIQSAADKPATPITTENKPVEPWGGEDECRLYELCRKHSCKNCPIPNKLNKKSHNDCLEWTSSHPAEARKIMDDMEGKKE